MKPEKLFLNLDFLYEASSSELTEIEEKSKSTASVPGLRVSTIPAAFAK